MKLLATAILMTVEEEEERKEKGKRNVQSQIWNNFLLPRKTLGRVSASVSSNSWVAE